jgi:hypothetical protein
MGTQSASDRILILRMDFSLLGDTDLAQWETYSVYCFERVSLATLLKTYFKTLINLTRVLIFVALKRSILNK